MKNNHYDILERVVMCFRFKSTTLEELLLKVTPENLPKEVSTGEPQGRESW